MDEQRDDLRATADELIRDTDELRTIEQAKRAEHPRTGRFRRLTERAEHVAQRILRLTRAQRQLTDEVSEPSADRGELPQQS